MSETVAYKGRLYPILTNLPLEEASKLLVRKEIPNLSKYEEFPDTYLEILQEELSGKYLVINNVIYKYTRVEYDYNYKADARLNDDGTIDFDVIYYNGGCCFSEAVASAVEKLNE